MPSLWIAIGIGVFALLALFYAIGRRGRKLQPEEARRQFLQQREHLEAKFFELAAASGKPRGLLWLGGDWESTVELARDRKTGQIAAFVGVTLRFEAIPGSDMEGLPAVGNLRNATGIFFHDGRNWQASGRALFNMNPDEAIQHFGKQFEPLAVGHG